MEEEMFVVLEHYTGHTHPIAVLDDEGLAERYATAMDDTTDGWHEYTVEKANFVDEEGVEFIEPKEISDAEYEAERDAMRADDYWAEHGSAGLANLH